LDEYRKNFEKDGALERRFQKVIIEGSSKEDTITILKNVKDKYESYHKVTYNDEVIRTCVDLADRYITDREFPDKAFDILDEVGARSQVDVKMPEIIEDLKLQAQNIKKEKIEVVKKQNYEEAAQLRDKEKKILTQLNFEKKKFEEQMIGNKKEVEIELVYEVVSNMTNIPVTKLSVEDSNSLINLESSLNKLVIGQSEAVSRISKSIRRNRLGIKDPNKPIGSFIFLGNTGVGKTYLAKQLAKEIFGSDESLIRVDMSEYQEKHNISRLIGSPPGFVGYDEGGQLTEQVKNKPYSVVLFDEVEKAHKDIFSVMLQILDDGFVTDAIGKKINFKNCLIIMTSNLGVKKLQDFGTGIGFGNNNKYIKEEMRKDTLNKELKKFFSPEFLNRIDETIVFNTLNEDDVKKIVVIELGKLKLRIEGIKYNIDFDDTVVDYVSKAGFDEVYGARPLKRAIQDKVEDFISEEILKNNLSIDKKYIIKIVDDVAVLEEQREKKVKKTKKGE
jgi:ATP-dependent Clp protease ATP-binding subunit ClpC